MWRKLLFVALWLGSASAHGSSLLAMTCEPQADGHSLCRIQLEGEVMEGERLFFETAQDSDRVSYRDKEIGSTGFLLNYPYAASFFPRIYSLQPLRGQVSPTLMMETQAFFPSSRAMPTKAKVISASFSLRKAYSALLLRTFSFLAVLALSFFVVLWVRRTTIDGWTYPHDELRWFFGSLCAFMLLRSDWSHVAVPSVWSAPLHQFAADLSLAVNLWAASTLLLAVRFNDRSCVERGLYHRPAPAYSLLSDLSLVAALVALSPPFQLGTLALAVQSVPALLALYASVRSLEWKRVLKRSGPSPLLFHFSLILFTASTALLPLLAFFGAGEKFLGWSAWAALAFGAWRMHRYLKAKRRGHALAQECREALLNRDGGGDRLNALCEFIEDEWAAARVSVISVEGDLGLVLASAGPEAIQPAQRTSARKLGPFLRRVCREGHILYAPVAEELGKDLQDQGMKHSSLALPFRQKGKVRAVLCMMADEGERIPAMDATLLEILAGELSLEILSASAQHVAEEKCEHLLAIAREADGIAVEHLDNWGHLHYAEKEEIRFLVGAKLEPAFLTTDHSPLRKAQLGFQRELKAVWHSLALAFEFVPKEIKEDFWVLSPKDFRNPYLRALGGEKVALLLAAALERHARLLAAKEGYLLLGNPLAKVIAGRARLHLISYGAQGSGGLDVDANDFATLHRLRDRATASGPVCWLASVPAGFRALRLGRESEQDFCSILGVTADKKETRKLETKALENARDSLKKAA